MFTRKYFIECIVFSNKNYSIFKRNVKLLNANEELLSFCEKEFDLPDYKVASIMLKWPSLQKIQENQIKVVLNSLYKIGINKEDVIKQPTILNSHPITIENRSNALYECGFQKIDLPLLSRYITLMGKKTISELKHQGFIPPTINVWDQLIQCFDIWPDIQLKLADTSNHDDMTLVDIRMKILQKCLELKYDFPKDGFEKMRKTYLVLKHRSLRTISLSFDFAENQLHFPKHKIVNCSPIFIMDKYNVSKMLTEVKDIAGVDIKTIVLKQPTLLRTNYMSLIAIKEILKNENISNEAQQRCLKVFTLCPETVQERLKEIKSNTTLKPLYKNPRILSLVYFRNKVFRRMEHLNAINKKCLSLHKLVSTEEEFSRYAVSFGDKTRGVDVIKTLKNYVDPIEFDSKIKKKLVSHPFWTHIPLHFIMTTFEYLQSQFTIGDIIQNIELLLYPLEEIKSCLNAIVDLEQSKCTNIDNIVYNINLNTLTNAQRLSLLIYIIEKNHNFTGNGVWPKQIGDCKISTSQ